MLERMEDGMVLDRAGDDVSSEGAAGAGARLLQAREGLLLRGPSGWGEWAPFIEYDDDVAATWLAAAIEAAFGDDDTRGTVR